ncbi:Choline transport protein [Elsinoe australis]|uniref:Choline transport protein n=1 Tax=Elsinoe australis TaxID=40998 RepID=A0A2P7ZDP1_9PEZI|nr:Choline transport protein [Elsinoe australis]
MDLTTEYKPAIEAAALDRTESAVCESDLKGSTAADMQHMERMGKQQQLQRNFRQITSFSFSMILVATWETVFGVAGLGLTNGGSAGFIYMYIVVWIAFLCVYTSMAEMGSMAPTSGGQYHWVSEFAPPKYQKVLSYIVGWLSVLGWQTSVAAVSYLVATEIQGLIVLNQPSYTFERWHGTLLMIAVASLAALFNILLSKHLPTIEGLILILHLAGFLAILVPLWTLNPAATPTTVFTTFRNNGWDSTGTSCLVGILAPILTMLGADSVAHMSEEIRDASRALPRAIVYSCAFNGLLGLIMAITLCFVIGDVDTVLATPTGFVFIQLFYNTTGSLLATNAMCAVVIIVAFFAVITIMASASRQCFAFARDDGLPGSKWLRGVKEGWDLPLNAIYLSLGVAVLLSLIVVGSAAAFNSLTSLGAVALLSSYIFCVGCFLWNRLTGKVRLPSEFDLGRWSPVVSAVAVAGLLVMFVFAFFPPAPKPMLQAVNMNWSCLIFGSACAWGAGYYVLVARK